MIEFFADERLSDRLIMKEGLKERMIEFFADERLSEGLIMKEGLKERMIELVFNK